MAATTTGRIKHAIRTKYAWPGGYALYLLMSDGEAVCPDCARAEWRSICYSTRHQLRDDWAVVGVGTTEHDDGEPTICAHCGLEVGR